MRQMGNYNGDYGSQNKPFHVENFLKGPKEASSDTKTRRLLEVKDGCVVGGTGKKRLKNLKD